MNIKYIYYLQLIIFGLLSMTNLEGQNLGENAEQKPPFQIDGAAIDNNNDTVPIVFYGTYTVKDVLRHEDEQKRLNKMKRDIVKVYPYSQRALTILREIDDVSGNLEKKRDKKKYINDLEDELMGIFKKELTRLTTSQGKILIKLIERETGRPIYNTMDELTGPVKLWMWQAIANKWGYNLKEGYRPESVKEHKDIENFMQQLETLGIQSLDPTAKIDSTIYTQSEASKKSLQKQNQRNEEKRLKEEEKQQKEAEKQRKNEEKKQKELEKKQQQKQPK